MAAVNQDIPQDYPNELDDRADWYVPMAAYDLYSAALLLHAHPHRSLCQHDIRSYMLSLVLPVYLKIADLAVYLDLASMWNYRIWKNPVISMVLAQQVRGFYLKVYGQAP